jgi:hypothetical protein
MKMKKYALIAGLLMVQAPFAQNAEAIDVAKMATKLIASVAGKDKFCRQANFWGGTISVRSFEGQLCTKKGIAAIALKKCPGIDGFENSKCYKEAQVFIKNKTVDQLVQEVKEADPDIAKLDAKTN